MKYKYINKKILITGGNGFLGKKIYQKLKEKKYKKIFVFKKKEFDLTSLSQTKTLFRTIKPDIVINLAAVVGGINFSRKFPKKIFFDNMRIQLNTIQCCAKSNILKLINIGSACIYSDKNIPPFNEKDYNNKKMHDSVLFYGFSKLTQIVASKAIEKNKKFNSINLLPANLYGASDKFDADYSHVIPAMIKKFSLSKKKGLKHVEFYGSGNTIREFLHVNDCAEAIIKSMEMYNSSDPLNIGTGEGVKIKTLANTIAKIVNFRGKIIWNKKIEDGAKIKVLDIKKMKKNLKWKPEINLENGIKEMIYLLKMKRNFF